MDQGEIETLLHLIDQRIEKSEPREAEYWRGYRQGVNFRIRHRMGESIREHYRLLEATTNSGDPYVDAYARGCRNGCEGKKLEDTPYE